MQDTPLTVAVVGCGRIGSPLACYLSQQQSVAEVIGVDIDQKQVNFLNAGIVPFHEPGMEEPLVEMREQKKLRFMHRSTLFEKKDRPEIDVMILTLGTEVDEYGSPQVMKFIRHAMAYIHALQPRYVMTRSTVAIGTNRRLEQEIARQGLGHKTTVLSAPERIAEGKAFEELPKLPQILGVSDPKAKGPLLKKHDQVLTATRLFPNIQNSLVVSFEEAEFAKLASNAWRYVTFAAANEFEMLAKEHGLNFRRIRDAMIEDYPRNTGLPTPGLAAGPCLRKDSLQLTRHSLPTGLIATAVDVNEFYAIHSAKYVLEVLESLPYVQQVVLIGMAFKAGSDDIRDSLSFRVAEELRVAGVHPVLYDPRLSDYNNTEFLELTSTTLFVWLHSPSSPDLAALAKKVMSNKNLNIIV